MLDPTSKKMLPAAPSPDGPQNQTESKPTIIEAELALEGEERAKAL